MAENPNPEFSRPVLLRSLRETRSGSPREIRVEASRAECGRIARRLQIPDVSALSCRYQLTLEARDTVLAEGSLTATVTQTCVLTLEDFQDVIAERFVVRFVPEADFREDVEGDPDQMDEIPFAGDSIDLGEATVEQLALTLPSYPHRPGAERPQGVVTEEDLADEPAKPVSRPFDALAKLKAGKK